MVGILSTALRTGSYGARDYRERSATSPLVKNEPIRIVEIKFTAQEKHIMSECTGDCFDVAATTARMAPRAAESAKVSVSVTCPMRLRRREDGSGWDVTFPLFPGLSATGPNYPTALQEGKHALQVFLKAEFKRMRENGSQMTHASYSTAPRSDVIEMVTTALVV